MALDQFPLRLSRRQFLLTAAALPALLSSGSDAAWAGLGIRAAPYLSLEKFIPPGVDEFGGEREAAEIEIAFAAALHGTSLPLSEHPAGFSPNPFLYRSLADDVLSGTFDHGDHDIASGWRRWVQALGSIRRSRFFRLPDGIVRFEIASQAADGKLQYRTGEWKVSWESGKITTFQPIQEHVTSSDRPYFRDVTAAVFAGVPSFAQQLSRGTPYWRSRLDPATGIDLYGSNGIAVGDIDGDGSDEIYVCQGGGLPNRLYKISALGEARDITEAWGAGLLDDTSCALFLDLRNTGRQDLVVLRSSGPLLFLNDGSKFRLRTDAFRFSTLPSGGFTGMAAADFDRDGKLDLYLCCYVYFQSEAQYTYASPYHDARNGPPNFLFRNHLAEDGAGTFDDCTAETGMNENNDRFSFAPAWCDFNGDGWPDLYVANDFGRKNLYVNENGRFHDQAAAANVEDMGPGMSAAWFDYNRDGKPDLYVANMWTAAGQRVMHDPHFAPAQHADTAEAYTRHTMGNSLYRNRGDGTFENTTASQAAGFGRWAWGSGGHDFDNDGIPEIFVTCGMLTNTSTTDLSSFFWRQVVARSPIKREPSAAYENGWNAINQFIREDYSWNGREPNVLHVRRGDRYFDFSGVSGLDFADDSRAFSVTDIDGDGRPDLIVKSRLGPQVRVLQNDCTGGRHSIAFQLRGTQSNRDAIGTRVEVDGQTKWLEAGSGFLSQNTKTILFGLGDADIVKRVHVTWPSGVTQEFHDLRAGSRYHLTEGSPDVTPAPFRPPHPLAAGTPDSRNDEHLDDTWFIEPVPLPEPHPGTRLLILTDGQPVTERYPARTRVLDFTKQPPATRHVYEIFRRYLFDWRTTLTTPLAFLLNESGNAIKVYAQPPSLQQYSSDLASADHATGPASLPFPGFYVKPPARDFFKFGAAFLWVGHYEQALPYLEEVLRRTPNNARVLVLVGQIHHEGGRLDAAEASYRRAREVNPDDAEAWSGLGDVSDSRNNPREALDRYEKALALKPDLLYTLLNAGRAADALNLQPQAESFYRRALDRDSASPEAANGLGLSLAKQGRSQDAQAFFEQAISRRRDYSEAVNNLGVLFLQMGKTNDAIAAFEYGIGVAPEQEILYMNLGRTYAHMGKLVQARQTMERLLERKPGNAAAERAIRELDAAPAK